jgi:hypothetical protein
MELDTTMHRRALTIAVCLLLAASVRDAAAQASQAWTDRGYVNLNVGFESTSGTLNDATTFTLYDEAGTKAVEASTDSGSIFDFSVGSRVWRNVSVGIGYHRGSTSGEAAVSASVPNPLFFNRHRAVAFGVSDLNRTEQAFHIQVGYMLPISDKLDVHVFAGPSFFRLKQDVVADVSFAETGNNAVVNGTGVVQERSDSAGGANIGVDVAYKLYETLDWKVGAGMFIRYAGASGKVTVMQNTLDSDVGGLQIGFGARVRF